jgi:putative ABC transport system permease protein
MVLRETAVLVAAGLLLGLPTIVAGRWIATFLYGLTPADPITLALTVAALATVDRLSEWMPARTDPMIALRHE